MASSDVETPQAEPAPSNASLGCEVEVLTKASEPWRKRSVAWLWVELTPGTTHAGSETRLGYACGRHGLNAEFALSHESYSSAAKEVDVGDLKRALQGGCPSVVLALAKGNGINDNTVFIQSKKKRFLMSRGSDVVLGTMQDGTRVRIVDVRVSYWGSKEGWTPLHWASNYGCLSLAGSLVEMGAEVDKADAKGQTPLALACGKGHLDMAKLLLSGGRADVNRTDNYGRTPLHQACTFRHLPIAQLLVESGAEVDMVDGTGCSPLADAADSLRNGDTIRLLLDAGADANRCTDEGQMPLHIALSHGYEENANELLEWGLRSKPA